MDLLSRSRSLTDDSQAEKADPRDPVYPSNLSAALFESGDYAGSADAVLRSWKLLEERGDMASDLVVRLSIRLARALCHGARARLPLHDTLTRNSTEIEQLKATAAEKLSDGGKTALREESCRAWKVWEATHAEMTQDAEGKTQACLHGLSRLPLFCKPL